MSMKERSFPSDAYRYGFNGKEMDDEMRGDGNSYDYGFRMYDPRLARFMSVDPWANKFPMLSSYQFAANTPIWCVDLDGLEARVYNDLSALPHSFISVIDAEGVINVYTFGQYGQNGADSPLEQMFNENGALVHLRGDAANEYIRKEFEMYGNKLQVYEISDKEVDKKAIIEYYASEMKKYNIPAEGASEEVMLASNYPNDGSGAVKYKPYWLTNYKDCGANCTSVVLDGLNKGGEDYVSRRSNSFADPWVLDLQLDLISVYNRNYTNVTFDARNKAEKNVNGSKPQGQKGGERRLGRDRSYD